MLQAGSLHYLDWEGINLDGMLVLSAAVAVGLFVYLILALVKPEMFA